MSDKKYEVTLNSSDIIEITEIICKRDESIRKNVGPAGLEYEIFCAIRDIKKVDFFKEEEELIRKDK